MSRERSPHIIMQKISNEKPQNVVYMDTESYPMEDLSHDHYLTRATFVRRYRHDRRERVYTKESGLANFWRDLCVFTRTKSTTYCYAHNMGYDIVASGGVPVLEDLGFKLFSFFEKGTTFIYQFANEDEKKKIYILSTMNFYVVPLKKLAKTFGMEKIDIEAKYGYNYRNIPLAEAIEYCKKDVDIIEVAMESLFKFVEEEDLGNMAKTAAGQAFNAYTHRFMPEPIYVHCDTNALALEREGYYGGRVECWRLGEWSCEAPYYYIDVNSMYPYVMKEFTYPTKLLRYVANASLSQLRLALETRGVMAKVKIKTDFPYFPKRTKNKLIFPVGEFWTVLSTPELQYALEHDLIVDIREMSIYEMHPIFAGYVDYFYNRRLEAKADGDEVMTFFYKLLLNCLYGKFGQMAEEWTIIGECEKGEVGHEIYLNGATKETYEIKKFGGHIFRKGAVAESFNSFPAIAAHVTAYARQHLLMHILRAGKENILYMDTDSLFSTKTGYDRLLGTLDEKKLGRMKVEAVGLSVQVNAPKDYYFNVIDDTFLVEYGDNKPLTQLEYDCYMENRKRTMTAEEWKKWEKKYAPMVKRKGISKDARPLTDEEYEQFIAKKKSELSANKFAEFMATYKREDFTYNLQWCKMNTFLNEGDLSKFHNIARIKSLRREYGKGIVQPDRTVLPFEIRE